MERFLECSAGRHGQRTTKQGRRRRRQRPHSPDTNPLGNRPEHGVTRAGFEGFVKPIVVDRSTIGPQLGGRMRVCHQQLEGVLVANQIAPNARPAHEEALCGSGVAQR